MARGEEEKNIPADVTRNHKFRMGFFYPSCVLGALLKGKGHGEKKKDFVGKGMRRSKCFPPCYFHLGLFECARSKR